MDAFLALQVLFPAPKSPCKSTATVTIAYGGERFDPAAGENDLAYTVLKRSIHEITYSYTEGAELSNTVCAVVRS